MGLSAPYSVVFHSVPFASGNRVWDEAELIDVDKFGRELYLYEIIPDFLPAASDFSTSVGFYVLVVCQKSNDTSVYYYEDKCYLLLKSEKYTVNDLAAIKEANDWDYPYEESKFTAVPNSFKQPVVAEETDCIQSFRNKIDIDHRYELAFDEITVNNSESLCVIREYYSKPNNRNGTDYFFGSSYIALFDNNSNLIECSSFENSFDKFQEEILAFKQRQGTVCEDRGRFAKTGDGSVSSSG